MKNKLSKNILDRLQKKSIDLSKIEHNHEFMQILEELDIYEAELNAQSQELYDSELALLNQQIEYETLFDNSPLAYLIVNEKFEILRFNYKANEYFNLSAYKSVTKTCMSIISASDFNRFFEFFKSSNHSITLNCNVVKDHATEKESFKLFNFIYDNNNSSYHLLILFSNQLEKDDLEKIQKLEKCQFEQELLLAKQSRMASLGEMLENIAHQWRQPLATITAVTNSVMLSMSLEHDIPQEKLLSQMQTIEEQATYLSDTIAHFRSYLSNDSVAFQYLELSDVVNSVLHLTESMLNQYQIDVLTSLETINIKTIKNDLIQVLINIINNSKDALAELDEARVIEISLSTNANVAILTISDNAKGINPEAIHNIFDPYFTTKGPSVGTGLGLYIAYITVVEKLGGTIVVENKEFSYNGLVCKGAEFTITLPLVLPDKMIVQDKDDKVI